MKEADIVRKIQTAVRHMCPTAYIVKLADRHRRGLPDLLAIVKTKYGYAVTVFIEVKRPGGKVSPVQFCEHKRILAAGGAVIVVTSAEEVTDWLRDIGVVG